MKMFCALILAGCLLATPASAQSPVTVAVDTRSPGFSIPDDFSGLSFETSHLLLNRAGRHFFSATNTPLITLFRNLGLGNLRLGGGTADLPDYDIPGLKDIDNLFAFARVAGVKVIYSLRLLNGSTNIDATLARYIWMHYRSQLACFAIGNEPDWKSYHHSDPRITNYTSYLAAWNDFAAAITNAAPGARFAAPDTGGNILTGPPNEGPGPSWTTAFARAEKNSGMIALITQHHYVGEKPSEKSARTAINEMLSPLWNTVTNQTLFQVMARPVMSEGLPYRFTEADDYVVGVPGASDTFAAALWALDFMHWWAAHGCAGVNFHNRRWIPNDTITRDWSGRLVINPKGYGIKAFDLGGHGRVMPATITNPDRLNLTAYAVADSNRLYVTLVNKEHGERGRSAVVTIRSGNFSGPAAAMFLAAPAGNVAARTGITLGGAPITARAPWKGTWMPLQRGTDKQWTVTITAASAAVVSIARTLTGN